MAGRGLYFCLPIAFTTYGRITSAMMSADDLGLQNSLLFFFFFPTFYCIRICSVKVTREAEMTHLGWRTCESICTSFWNSSYSVCDRNWLRYMIFTATWQPLEPLCMLSLSLWVCVFVFACLCILPRLRPHTSNPLQTALRTSPKWPLPRIPGAHFSSSQSIRSIEGPVSVSCWYITPHSGNSLHRKKKHSPYTTGPER